jgi:alanine racemase
VAVARALGVGFDDQRALPDAPWGLGIATLDEAELLREAGCLGRIVCLQPLLPNELPRAHALAVTPALHRPTDIARWATLGAPEEPAAPYHLSIDTGMARAGIRWDEVATLREIVQQVPPQGVFTHFHSADESLAARDEQDRRFASALAELRDVLPPDVLLHSDNSGAIVSRHAGSPGQLARPGIALYAGLFSNELGLRQVVHVRARIIDLRAVHEGESVSYGATWHAPGPRRIATIACGYADGYRRHLSNAGVVLINGVRCPVVGRVTMDMIMVDVSAVHCDVGQVATLVGHDGQDSLTVETVAGLAGVSPYELLVGLTLRIPAVYHASIASSIPSSV